MGLPSVMVFTPASDEYQILAAELAGGEFTTFTVSLVETGPGQINTALTAAQHLTRLADSRQKPLAVIGAGIAGSLSLKLKAGETLWSDSAVLGDWAMETDHAFTFGAYGRPAYEALGGAEPPPALVRACPAPLIREWGSRLAAKGFRPSRLLSSDTYFAGLSTKLERGRLFGCAAADSESGALALAAAKFDLPWVNLRVVADTLDEELAAADPLGLDIREVLALKLLVALSTLDQMPHSGCGGCSSPCGLTLK